jgi:hypothetical protein
MATQIAWLVYYFFADSSHVERPRGFVPKSIVAEAVDGPHGYDAVRISLWLEAAVFRAVSNQPISLDRFKHPKEYQRATHLRGGSFTTCSTSSSRRRTG